MAKRKKRGPGRHTKLTKAVHACIVEALEEGAPLRLAAELAGVSEDTVREWIARGEGRDHRPSAPVYAGFARAVAGARARGEEALLSRVRSGVLGSPEMPHDWRASAWLLERTRPEQYGQTVQVRAKVDAELQGILDRLGAGLDPATFERVVELLSDGEPGEGDPP